MPCGVTMIVHWDTPSTISSWATERGATKSRSSFILSMFCVGDAPRRAVSDRECRCSEKVGSDGECHCRWTVMHRLTQGLSEYSLMEQDQKDYRADSSPLGDTMGLGDDTIKFTQFMLFLDNVRPHTHPVLLFTLSRWTPRLVVMFFQESVILREYSRQCLQNVEQGVRIAHCLEHSQKI